MKHFVVSAADAEGSFTHFAANIIERAALGLVVAEDFQEGAREKIEELGLVALSLQDLVRIVTLWDPLKQRAALNAFQWAVVHKEQNSGLIDRFNAFLEEVEYLPKKKVSAVPANDESEDADEVEEMEEAEAAAPEQAAE